ncbi:hypothetical protein M9H77_12996 [Catharanthus roseus]|uniref:Uncharacterized protein n=1 Tax=Catharanthus roseus TaxID=4058 RepID=A0ACC0BJ18_CATRO|nr:hypothetical protein M9H77_12996 [Catharanthus roseus]
MATKLLQHPPQPPPQSSHIFQPLANSTSTIIFKKITKIHKPLSATQFKPTKKCAKFCKNLNPLGFTTIAASSAKSRETTVGELHQIKETLYDSLQGINRGIFGVQSERKDEIKRLVEQLESCNPTPEPTENLEKMSGKWKLVYSTITILGAKRTKLGLRDFINLGDFFQNIDVIQGKAVNVIEFSAKGLNLLNGQLTIEAAFKVVSKSRVDISYENSSITPDQLMNVFKKNYDILLKIFNPEGWLEITYPFLCAYIFLMDSHFCLITIFFSGRRT